MFVISQVPPFFSSRNPIVLTEFYFDYYAVTKLMNEAEKQAGICTNNRTNGGLDIMLDIVLLVAHRKTTPKQTSSNLLPKAPVSAVPSNVGLTPPTLAGTKDKGHKPLANCGGSF